MFEISFDKIDYYTVFGISLDIEKPNINSESLQKKEIKESKRRYHCSKPSMHTSRIRRGFHPHTVSVTATITVVA